MSVDGPKAEKLDLTKLTAETVRLEHLRLFPVMTSWFRPILLAKLLFGVILSDVFGQYAYRRLIEAVLDRVSPPESFTHTDLSRSVAAGDGPVWIDYVSDLGDGFDATYAVAYLMAQPVLRPDGLELPRGGMVVMGGDEVYPIADRRDYIVKLRLPYEFAWPDSDADPHPSLFALPGNHDWYDGLVVFLAMFCRSKPSKIGNWRTRQRRSYFAVKLTEEWWLWGIDIALVHDMDQPQADYFVAAAEAMPEGGNIILCSAEPGWYEAESEGESFRTLSYAAWIAENAKKELNIPLVLSGDSHHYARYSRDGTEFITAGGGGAFLHGTHHLKPTIIADWLEYAKATLALKSVYPTMETSKSLLRRNLFFFEFNQRFSILLGTGYWVAVFVLTLLWHFHGPVYDVGVATFVMTLITLCVYSYYQEGPSERRILGLAAIHATVHFAMIVALSALAVWWIARAFPYADMHWGLWAIATALLVIPIGTVIAGTIFGVYLLITCRYFGLNHNDAFSAMKLDYFRHFLRLQIRGDTLTVFPIGIDRVPSRAEWKANEHRDPGSAPSVFESSEPMKAHLIEPPIVIRGREAVSTRDIKSPPGSAPVD